MQEFTLSLTPKALQSIFCCAVKVIRKLSDNTCIGHYFLSDPIGECACLLVQSYRSTDNGTPPIKRQQVMTSPTWEIPNTWLIMIIKTFIKRCGCEESRRHRGLVVSADGSQVVCWQAKLVHRSRDESGGRLLREWGRNPQRESSCSRYVTNAM